MYLKKAQFEKPYLYEILYDTSDLANRFVPNREKTVTLENKSRSKLHKDTVKPYNYTHQNSLYEIFKPPSKQYLDQLERAKEVRKTMWRKTFVRTKPNIAKNVAFLPVLKSISKSRQAYNDMTFDIKHFRKLVDQARFKHSSDTFRAPTALDMEVLIKDLLMKDLLMPLSIKTLNDSFHFEHELKIEMREDLEYVKSLEKENDELESEKADFSNIYDLLLEECVKECECLAQKLSKQTDTVSKEVHNKILRSFSKLEQHSHSLELALQQCKDQMKNDTVCKQNGSNVFLKEREQYHEIQDLKAQMQDKNIAISELKKLTEKCRGKFVETQFDKQCVVRQPNTQRIPKPSVLGKPTPFSNSPEMRRINHSTSVSRPQLKRYQVKEKVLPNNSQVKFKGSEVEDHHRISSNSKKTKSVTACNDSLNSRTSNVNVVCADCGQCVFNSNHDACVSRYLNDVNARTKKPNVVPISASKPKRKANKSVATSHKKIVASDTTIQKSKSYYKELHFWGTVRFGNDQFAPILGYGDLIKECPRSNCLLRRRPQPTIFLSFVNFSDAEWRGSTLSSCEMSKAKRSSFKTKAVPSSEGRLNLLHMDLCGPMRVASINGKKYILVIVDDYSRYTWILFLRSKDETPETSTARTPEQNGGFERWNRTLVETARTMLSASKLPLSIWAEAVAIACYTQNRSIIISAHGKTAYYIINDRKPSIKHLHIFGCICYITRDGENLDKMKEKGDPCVMVGYSTRSKAYRVYNKRTRLIVESIHIKFNEIKEMMSDHYCSDLAPQRQEMSVENVSSGLFPQGQKASDYDNFDPVPPRQNVVPIVEKTDSSHQGLEFLFSPLIEEYYNPAHGHAEDNNNDQAPNASFQEDEFINPICTRVQEIGESSSRNNDNTSVHSFQPQSHDYRWTKDHPLEEVQGNPTMPVQTR
ncbi:reverse transcriptase domain-containing protein [Tanacetum coccineum]